MKSTSTPLAARKPKRTRFLLLLGLLFALGIAAVVRADHTPFWSSVDGGGGAVAAGGYTLTSAIGQADAGVLVGSGEYTVVGGVLAAGSGGAMEQDQRIFLPEVFR